MLVALCIYQAKSTVLSKIVSNLFRCPLTLWWAMKTFPSTPQGESECKHIIPSVQLLGTLSTFLSLLPKLVTLSPTSHSWNGQHFPEDCSPLVTFLSSPNQDCLVTSHHITFHSPSVYGAFSSRQTLFEVLGTQQRGKESKIPAWGLHSSGEKRKQTRDGDRVLLVDLAVCSREGPEGGKDTWVDETEAGDQWGKGGNSVVVGDRGQGGRGLEGSGAGRDCRWQVYGGTVSGQRPRDGGLGGTRPAAGSRG